MQRKKLITWLLAALCVGTLSFGAACDETGEDSSITSGGSVSISESDDSSSVEDEISSSEESSSIEESSSTPDESSVEESSSEDGSLEDSSSIPTHEHTFKTEWSYDEDCHWKVCETDGCVEKSEQADHHFMQETSHGADYIETVYTCDICAYTYTDRLTVDTVVPDEKTWIDAFNDLDYTNYTVHAKFGDEGNTYDNKVEISESAAHFLIGGYFQDSPVGADEYYVTNEYYTILQTDGSYNTYARIDNAENFNLLNDHSNLWYVNARMQSLLALKYNEHYEDFVYNEEKGTYFCSTVIETEYYPYPEDPDFCKDMYCTNVEIKVANGAIIYVASDYVADFDSEPTAEDFDSKLLYDNIGLTVVTLPSGVAENALPDDGSFYL